MRPEFLKWCRCAGSDRKATAIKTVRMENDTSMIKKNAGSLWNRIGKLKVGRIDRYIMRKFIGTYLFTILLLVVIVAIFHAVENITDFIERNATMRDILLVYYPNFVPFFINQFSGLITFIAVIFFTSKMAYNTEIIAILSGGVSFKRLMWPYFLSAFLIASLSLALNLFILPESNKVRIDFEQKYLKKGLRGNYEELIYRQISPNTFICIKGYNNLTKSAEFMTLETYDGGRIVSSLLARAPRFNVQTKRWTASHYLARENINGVEVLQKKRNLDTMINLSANELGKVNNYIQTLNIVSLRRFIREQERKGSDMVSAFKVDMYNRFAYPVSTFILTLIGVSLSSRKVRGGTGVHIGVGITLCFAYILVMQFANEFAKGGVLPPVVSVWMPNVIFAFIAVYLYKKAPK